MFVCTHPAIDPAPRAALMLQTVLGIAFEVPGADEWPGRLADVLEAIYAAYGTGWDDVAGTDPERSGLAQEALTLAAMLAHLVGDAAEAWGLLALLAFCQSRAGARRDGAGDYVPLLAQDTSLWDRELLGVGEAALHRAAALATPGAFQLEAAIQSAHTQRRLGASVPDAAIVALYDALVATRPTIGAIVSRACAVGAAHGAAAGRAALGALAVDVVDGYQPYWAALAHLAAAEGDAKTAQAARERAVGLSTDPAVRRFLLRATEQR